jgi:hypothetical protein
VHTGFSWENVRERDHLKDLSIDGRLILKWISKQWDGGMDWIDLAEGRSRLQAVVNAVMNLWVP